MAFKNWNQAKAKRSPLEGTLARKVYEAPINQNRETAVAVQEIVDDVDEIATEMDAKWGVERVVDKCPDINLKGRFLGQRQKFDDALLRSDNINEIHAHAQSLINGYKALDQAAGKAGIRTAFECGYLEVLRDGRVWRFITAGTQMQPDPDDKRHVTFVVIDACVNLLLGEKNKLANEVTKTFAGTVIERVHRKDDLNDSLDDIFPTDKGSGGKAKKKTA